MKLQVLVDDEDMGTVELAGAGILPYGNVVSSFCQIVVNMYDKENPESPDYLTISGAQVSLKSRVRSSRRRRMA